MTDEDRAVLTRGNMSKGSMTLREYFAGIAMSSLIINGFGGELNPEVISRKAYEYAEEMIREGR